MTLDLIKRLNNFEQLQSVNTRRVELIDFDLRKPNRVLAQAMEEFTFVSQELKNCEQKQLR